MACSKEELEISDEDLCPICSDVNKSPRRIPTCGHTFCENCLFTFVFDLKEQGELDTTFDCPVCRQPHPLQNTGEVTLEWIQTFPSSDDCSETDKSSCDVVSEETEESRKCDPCSEVAVEICAKRFCIDCQEYICDGCVEAHKKFKAFRSHKLLDICEITDCANLLLDFHKHRKCPKHPDRDVELFCRDDETCICLLCATSAHKNCRNVMEVSECSEESKEKVEELKHRVTETQKHLNAIEHVSRQNSTSVKTQTETVEREVADIRNTIVDSLDIIVENVVKRAKQIRQEVHDKETGIAENIERLNKIYDKKLLYLDSLNKYGSTPEIFICSTQLEAEVEKLEDDVITMDSTFENSDVDQPILDVLNKISEQLEPSKMPELTILNKASDRQPKFTLLKMPSPFQIGKVEQHKVRFTDKCSPTFTGITVDDDDNLILSDSCAFNNCGYMCLYNHGKKHKHELKLKQPYSSTMIDKQTVVSSMRSNKRITVVSLRYGMRIEKSLDTHFQPRCITSLRDGKVAISWTEPPGFSIADISGSTIRESQYFTQDSDGRKFQSFDFMAINETRKLVIQPCHEDKAVYCFEFTGKPVFKYTNNLKNPRGVAVDSKTGSVYVCDTSDACIHQLSARGQPITVIRHADLKNPLSVCYDKRRKCLWVTCGDYPYKTNILCFERA